MYVSACVRACVWGVVVGETVQNVIHINTRYNRLPWYLDVD